MPRNASLWASIETRLMSLLASLVFSVPTAAFIWLGVNKELAYWEGFLSSRYLIASIVIFALLDLLLPKLLPAIMGAVWRGILRIQHWWGW